MIHKMIDGVPVPANLRAEFPNTSFPADLSVAVLPDGYVWVIPTAPPECGQFERVEPATPVQIGGVWAQAWSVVPWTEEDFEVWRKTLECGPYQMALALQQLGLFETVDAFATQQGGMFEFAWRRSTTFKRLDPMTETMRQGLGKTPEEVDQLFLLAQTL